MEAGLQQFGLPVDWAGGIRDVREPVHRHEGHWS